MGTKISWCEETWNPVVGCSKCSPGCLNCYAERMAYRQVCMGAARHEKNPDWDESAWTAYSDVVDEDTHGWNGTVALRHDQLNKPLHWRNPRRIFVVSMGDLFGKAVPFEFIDKVYQTMIGAERHIYLLLTKRPKRMAEWVKHYAVIFNAFYYKIKTFARLGKHVHLGVSISTQAEADEKIPILLQIPAAVRWLSIEPMLEGIDLQLDYGIRQDCTGEIEPKQLSGVVIGAESKGGYAGRPCNLEWVRDVVRQCDAASVPVHIKQLHIDGKLVKNIKEFPKDLRRRELPNGE